MQTYGHDWSVAVRHCADRGEAELYGLVLSARGIENTILAEDGGFSVRVASEEAERARAEVDAYDAENQRRPADTKPAITTSPRQTISPMSPAGSSRPCSSTTRTSTPVRGWPTEPSTASSAST